MSAGFDIKNNVLIKYYGSESEIVIPEGVKSIKQHAFSDCHCLKIIHISSSVKTIEYDAFKGCKMLEQFIVDPENEIYSVQDGVLVHKAKNTLVWFPAGKKVSEYVIPENIKRIARYAFIDCINLKKIVIPASVEAIEDEVFPRFYSNNKFMFEEIEVAPKAGSILIGNKVFDFGNEEQPLVYPKLPVTFVKEKKVQILLGLGYCKNPSLYEGEYADIYKQYVKEYEKELFEEALWIGVWKFLKYYSMVSESSLFVIGLSEYDKVILLEEAVLNDDIDLVKKIIELFKTFEFSARALGLACFYSSIEMVKVLVEAGATFDYKYSDDLEYNYNVYRNNDFCLLIAEAVDCFNFKYHVGEIPYFDRENSPKLRADIAEYLLTQPKAGFNSSKVLFYSILWGCSEVKNRLIQNGIKLSKYYIDLLTSSSRLYERNVILITLSYLHAPQVIHVLKTFNSFLEETGSKIMLSQVVFENEYTSMLDADVLKVIFAETNTIKLNKAKILEKIIDKDDVEALKVVVLAGAMKTKTQREKAIAYATKQKKSATSAWLIDYINKTIDFAVEEAKEETKMFRELMADPNSVLALKKEWSYKKLENGTLQITSYKGSQIEVIIPSMIGKTAVTVIGEKAFTASNKARNKNENRINIKKIVIPNGIIEIRSNAFEGCKSLETIVLPSSIMKIGKRAFLGCENLRMINISKSTIIDECVFDGCTKLPNKDGMVIFNGVLYKYLTPQTKSDIVVIPDGVTKIASYAFNNLYRSIEQIILPQGLEEIGKSAFEGQFRLKKIDIPSSVKKIKKNAFRDIGLKEINLVHGLQRIGEAAFANTSLNKIRIPKSVTAIGPRAFFRCAKLKDVYIPSSVVKFGKEVFGYPDDYEERWNKPHGIVVHTPKGSVAEEYVKQYSGISVVNDYSEE